MGRGRASASRKLSVLHTVVLNTAARWCANPEFKKLMSGAHANGNSKERERINERGRKERGRGGKGENRGRRDRERRRRPRGEEKGISGETGCAKRYHRPSLLPQNCDPNPSHHPRRRSAAAKNGCFCKYLRPGPRCRDRCEWLA